jgi:mono/diheme cytochrome c family protein
MLQKIAVLLFVLFSIVILLNCGATKKDLSTADPPDQNYLAIYGQWIYERESCGSCHTQQVDQTGHNLVSLDGLGGRYPGGWFYLFLEDPAIMIPQTEMPSFRHLYEEPLSKKVAQKIVAKRSTVQKLNKNMVWDELLAQSDLIAREIEDLGGSVEKRTEVLALIAYLQQIPASKSQIALDSIENEKYLVAQKEWENVLRDNNSYILQIAQDKDNIPKGRFLFLSYCSACHGENAKGGVGPDLTDDRWIHGGSESDIARSIIYGVPEKGMISWRYQLSPQEVGELVAYVSSLGNTKPE